MQKTIKLLPLVTAMALTSPVLFAEEDDSSNDNVVTVVSQKRVQDEVTVPISVSSIGAEELQFSGANDLNDLSNMAPNFSTSGQEGYQSAIYMRGVGTWSRNIGFDTRVGVYLDGVYLGQSSALNQAMMGLEAAEIVRGPQGTLFGKNTVAGAVNLVSIKPHAEEAEGRVGVEVGNFNSTQVSGRFNLPLGEHTAVQLTAMDSAIDGEYFNLYSQEQVGGRDFSALRFQLTHEFSDQMELYFSYDNSDAEGSWLNGEALTDTFGQYPLETDPTLASVAGPLVGRILEPYTIMASVTPQNNYHNDGWNMTLSYTTDNNATIRAIAAVRDSDSFFVSDTDYSPLDFLYVDFTDVYQTKTQEIQYISPDNDDFEYLAGAYFYDQAGATVRNANPGQHIPILNAAFGLPCMGTVDITNPYSYCLEAGKTVFNRGTVDVNSWAAYTNMSYKIGDATHLDLGIRYTSEEKAADYALGTEQGGVNGIIFGVANGTVVDRFEDSFVSHNIGIRTQVGDTNYYAKWSTGFKSGGYNLDFIDQFALNEKARFFKETVDSYEVGVKGRYMDNRLKITAALFRTEYEDYQVNQFLPLGPNASTISIKNVPEARTQGLELGVNYRIDDNLSVELNFGNLSAEFGDFPGGGRRLPDGTNADATGNVMPYAPKTSISSAMTYETDLNDDAIFIAQIGVNFNSMQFTNTWNVSEHTTYGTDLNTGLPGPTGTIPFGTIDAHTLVNLRAGFIATSGNWDMFFWGKNVTGEDYLRDSFRDFFNTYTEQRADQTMYGLEMNYYF